MTNLKKFSWLLIAIAYALLIYLTNSTTSSIVRSRVPQNYDDLVVKFVSSINASDFTAASQILTSETSKEMIEANKAGFEKVFNHGSVEKIEPFHFSLGNYKGTETTQVDYSIVLSNQKKLASRTIFIEDKILRTDYFEGDRLIEENSIANASWSLPSTLLTIGFLAAFVLIVTAANKVLIDQPKMWGFWFVAVLTLGFTVFKGNWISGEWDYKLLYPMLGFPLITYSKNEFTPLFLEIGIPVFAIIYLIIRKKLPARPPRSDEKAQ